VPVSSRRTVSKMWKQLSAIVALVSWTASFVLWYHYAFTRSDVRQPESGRIYPLNTHGSIVYLTSHERFLLYGLMVVGAVCFLLTAGLHYIANRQLPRHS
jgi:hypothetical protein